MRVSDEDRAVMLPSGRQPLFSNRVAWAVTHLAQAGLLDRPARGVTQITDRGCEVLEKYPDQIDMKVLRQFPEYEEFRTRSKQRKGLSPSGTGKNNGVSREDLSPRDAIEDVIDTAHSAVAADLLARVLKQSPVFLEQLVLRLLVKMGYGGLETPAEHLGAPGDAGLDGLIRLDPRAPACSVNVRVCPNRGRGAGGFRRPELGDVSGQAGAGSRLEIGAPLCGPRFGMVRLSGRVRSPRPARRRAISGSGSRAPEGPGPRTGGAATLP
jgi:hypothetical protein